MVIVLPQKVKGGDVLFRFVQDGKERSYSVPADGMSLEKGKLYTCDVLINQYPGAGDKDVVISTRVEDWDESEPPIYVVFDALRIECFEKDNQAAAAATYIFGYRAGSIEGW